MNRAVSQALVASVVTSFGIACGGPTYPVAELVFFEAQRARQEECTIRSNGEFCVEPEQFDPAVNEVWAIERRGDRVFLYVEEEVWLMDPQPDGSDPFVDPHTATKRVDLADGSGCGTTKIRTIELVADDSTLTGTVRSSSVLEGPSSCGDTPAGERTVDGVTGFLGGP